MPSSVGYPTLSNRIISQEEMQQFRAICDEHQFGYGSFASLIVHDALTSQEQVAQYVKKMQEWEEDQKPASQQEMKALREQVRQQAEELEQLRAFKQTQLTALNSGH